MKNISSSYKHIVLFAFLYICLSSFVNAAPLKIMMLGDSITEGGGHIPDNPENNQSAYTGSKLIQNPDNISYRAKLFDLFIADGYTVGNSDSHVDFVGSRSGGSNYPTAFDMDHQGTSGWTSKQIRDEIDGYLTETPADIILLHIGTNDPGGISIGSNADASTANTTVNNVKQILNKIFAKNPNTKVFVARIIEARRSHTFAGGIVTPDNPWGLWNTTVLNDNIEEMVAAHPDTSNIKMVNMQSGAGLIYDPCGTNLGDMQPFHSDDNNKADLHPNENGYAKMAQTWFDALVASEWLPKLGTVVDTVAPVITLNGSPTVRLGVGETYIEAGATALDNVDGDISNHIIIVMNNVNTDVAGEYAVVYNVSDAASNKAIQVTRTVIVKADTSNKDWYQYDEVVNTATVTPLGGLDQSVLSVEDDLNAVFLVEMKTIALRYKFDVGNQVYLTANEHGKVTTGFKDDTTLKTGTVFNTGTKTVMKKEANKVIIVTTTKLKKNESFIIGGK